MSAEEIKIEKALNFLRDSAEEYGEITGQVIYLREKLKITEAMEFVSIDKGAETTKRMMAKASVSYSEVLDELRQAEVALIKLKSLREAADKAISWAQTKIKAKGQGIII